MGEVASRWALLASIALHGAVVALAFARPPSAVAAGPVRADFWGGSTFEVPVADTGQGSAAEPPSETKSEISTEGLDPSSGAQAPTPPAPAPATSTAPPPSTSIRHAPHTGGSTAAGAASSEGGSTGGTGTFGAEGSAPGVRDLVRSFVRAIPIVASSDPIWATLPLGAAGAVDVTLVLDEELRPHTKAPFESAIPQHLARLVNKTLLVMASGRFAVGAGGAAGAEQRLHIALAVTQESPPTQDLSAAGGAFGLRFEPPDDHQVSRAFFTLASGRRVEVSVRPLSAR